MRKPIAIVATLSAVAVALVVVALQRADVDPVVRAVRTAAPGAPAPEPAARVAIPGQPAEPVRRSPQRQPLGHTLQQTRWGLEYSHQVSMAEHVIDPTTVAGTWITTDLGPDHRRVEFKPDHLAGLEELPTPRQAHATFELGLERGRLDTIGFAPNTDPLAAELMTTLACAFSYTPGEGDAWQVEEEDRIGWFAATYRRDGAQVIRRHGRYRTLRNQALGQPSSLNPAGGVTYTFDEAGLVEVDVDTRITLELHAQLPKVVVRVRGNLRRLEERRVPSFEPQYAQADILSERRVDPMVAQRRSDQSLLDGTPREELLSFDDPRLQGQTDQARKARVSRFTRLKALLRLDPKATAELVEALREATPDVARTIASALAQAENPDSVDALAGLLSEDLADPTREAILRALGQAKPMTPGGWEALSYALEEEEQPRVASLAAGTAAQKLQDDGQSEMANDLIDQLLDAYAAATFLPDRLNLLTALGNTANLRVFPTLKAAFADPDARIRAHALFGMRRIDDPTVDQLLAAELASGLQMAAARTIAYRDPGLWMERLEAAVGKLPQAIDARIRHTLQTWQTAAAQQQQQS